MVPARDAAEDVTLVFFGYTHCPDICNVVLANIASALRGSPAAVRDATRLLFVTTDPARDTRQVVREYLDRFDPAYDGLIAPVGTVAQAASDLHVQLRAAGRLHRGLPRWTTAPTRRRSSTARPAWSGRPTWPSPTCAPTCSDLPDWHLSDRSRAHDRTGTRIA